jgi:glycine/serine hydroxymethyltransferase
MKENEMKQIASIISNVLSSPEDSSVLNEAQKKALALCEGFALPY